MQIYGAFQKRIEECDEALASVPVGNSVQGGIRFGREEVKVTKSPKVASSERMQHSLRGLQWRLVTAKARNRL
jgi:hypothetical protein